jgi:hypothetical protein
MISFTYNQEICLMDREDFEYGYRKKKTPDSPPLSIYGSVYTSVYESENNFFLERRMKERKQQFFSGNENE